MLHVKSKFKVAKRLGASVFEKTQTQKFALSEQRSQGRKKKGGRQGLSDYGKQMLEKQKVRYTYGLTEHQFRRYIDAAMKVIDSPESINEALEMRLDNTVYRSGLSKTRRGARQMVSHGHIRLNGRRVTVPSIRVEVGDELTIRDGSKDSTLFNMDAIKEAEGRVPSWVTFDASVMTVKVVGKPTLSAQSDFNYPAVFEYYSR